MSRRLVILAVAAIWIGLPAGAVQDLNLISLTPPAQEVTLGETVLVLLQMQFDQETLGGGVEVLFDQSVLAFSSFAFDEGLGDDPSFRRMPSTPAAGEPLVLGFGEFAGLGGTRTIGALSFDAVGVGVADLSTSGNQSPVGPFVSNEPPFTELLEVEFQGGSITVVPEPGTLALLLLGSAGLALSGSRRRARKSH